MNTHASSSSASSRTSRFGLKERGIEAFRAKRFPEVGRDGTERARDGRETDDERSLQAMDAYMHALETCGEDVAVLTNLSVDVSGIGRVPVGGGFGETRVGGERVVEERISSHGGRVRAHG